MNQDTVLLNLKVLSMLREHDKLTSGPRLGLRAPSTLRSLSRWWYGETRQQDIEAV